MILMVFYIIATGCRRQKWQSPHADFRIWTIFWMVWR